MLFTMTKCDKANAHIKFVFVVEKIVLGAKIKTSYNLCLLYQQDRFQVFAQALNLVC